MMGCSEASSSASTCSTVAACCSTLTMRYVYYMQDHICVGDLLQRGSEGGDQRGRQLLDEAHRVGREHFPAPRQLDAPRRLDQRGEQLIGRIHI